MNRNIKIFSAVTFFIIALLIFFFGATYGLSKNDKESLQSFRANEMVPMGTVSLISPHHLLAVDLIDNIFRKNYELNKNSSIERIIILSPNHFNLGRGWAITSGNPAIGKESGVEYDTEAVSLLAGSNGLFYSDAAAFQKEHGVENLLFFAKKYFPSSKIVPIMIRDELPRGKADAIADFLADNFKEKTLIILSADFSHYVGKALSEMHDQKAIETISSLDFDKFSDLDIDCAGGLYVASKYSKKLGYRKFNFFENSNSSRIYGKDLGDENTSYVTGYFSKENPDQKIEKTAQLLFLGDLMLDRQNRIILDRKGAGWVTEKIKRIFWSQDLNIANLEGTITSNSSVSVMTKENELNHFLFTFDPQATGSFLKKNRIDEVSIGNNHVLNFGKDGLYQTRENLKKNEVSYFGDPLDENNFLFKNINGIKIALISYNDFSKISDEKTAEIIKNAKTQNDFVIIYAHWGIEYQTKENSEQRRVARSFVDAGADLVIGSHPHVIQPIEIYKDKVIFYSLGNFVFDQQFSEDVKKGLALAISISGNKTDYYLVPLYNNRGQVFLADEDARNEILTRLSLNLKTNDDIKDKIIQGKFSIPVD